MAFHFSIIPKDDPKQALRLRRFFMTLAIYIFNISISYLPIKQAWWICRHFTDFGLSAWRSILFYISSFALVSICGCLIPASLLSRCVSPALL